jgi:2-oxoglutarate ferredoxin oxidoreductase subunit alpha
MGDKILIQGGQAIAEAAVRAGCRFYSAYPITPTLEILEYMVNRMPEVNGVCVQAETEIAGISMVAGAAASGYRAMTGSAGLGISLMTETLSHLAEMELPSVIVDLTRMGLGAGGGDLVGFAPSQADYFQVTKGGGHGGYKLMVLAPASVQEAADLTFTAFDLADKYRNPAMILGDFLTSQMMAPVDFPDLQEVNNSKPWAMNGCRGREPVHFTGVIYEDRQDDLLEKYNTIQENEQQAESIHTDDAELVMVSYGSVSRVVREAVEEARNQGLKVGLLRPISLWPFPEKALKEAADGARSILVLELSHGQMIEDVRLAVEHKVPVELYKRASGTWPRIVEIVEAIKDKIG